MTKVKLINGFEVTPSHLETIAYYHGAIDPDSGHIICHGHTLKINVLVTPSRPVPIVMIGSCFGFTAGDENIAALLEVSEEVHGIEVRAGKLFVGGIEVDPAWGFHALGFSRDSLDAPRVYRFSVTLEDGKSVDAVLVRFTSPEHIAFVLFECKSEEPKPQSTMHV